MRILRAAFFLSVIAVLAPAPPEGEVERLMAGRAIPDNSELIEAAGSTVSDLGQFCSRQPEVCKTATYVAVQIEARAKYSVRRLYEWASDTNPSAVSHAPVSDQAALGDVMTGSTLAMAATDHGTLTAEDRKIAWRKGS
jgi:hypothetical protein